MSGADLVALLPLAILAATSVAVPLAIAVRRSHRASLCTASAGFAASLASLPIAGAMAPRSVSGMLVVDGLALFYIGLMVATALALMLLSYFYLSSRSLVREEYYALFPLTTLGAAVLASAIHFATFFLGLELLTVGLLVLIAYQRSSALTLEAGLKYLILAGVSSASVLFGLALLYFDSGSLELASIAAADRLSVLAWAGVLLVVAGLGFKLALVPFHLWTPDVFQGAPMPVAAFVATVSKTAVVAFLLRTLEPAAATGRLANVLSVLALASMSVGNLLALPQTNLKRLLGFSSVAHMGYLLIALIAGGPSGASAATFYLAAYAITSVAAFGVPIVLSSADGREADDVEGLRGLSRRKPALAAILAVGMLSLAGLPPTGGFVGKLYLMGSGVEAGLWPLLAGLVINSAIGVVYYLRVVIAAYRPAAEAAAQPAPAAQLALVGAAATGTGPLGLGGSAAAAVATLAPAAVAAGPSQAGSGPEFASGSTGERLLLVLITGVVIAMGVYPGPLIGWIGDLLALAAP